MKLKYFGTSAAEGIPALFCNCDICRHAARVRGKEVRTRSQALLDGRILIDFPSDTYMHVLHGGLDLRYIHTLLLTHSHNDHLYERDLWCRKEGIANAITEMPLSVYLTEAGYDRTAAFLAERMPASGRIALHKIEPFVPFVAEGYYITPLRAAHDPRANPVIFLIEKDGKTLFYANDTDIFPDDTWAWLEKHGRHIDLLSLDCTGMLGVQYSKRHMSFADNRTVIARMREMGLLDIGSMVSLTHFSHNAKTTHEEMLRAAEEYDYLVAYDGLEIEF